MCEQCEIQAKGLRSGKGSAWVSKYILARYACKHSPECECMKCKFFRDENEYADTGLFISDRETIV